MNIFNITISNNGSAFWSKVAMALLALIIISAWAGEFVFTNTVALAAFATMIIALLVVSFTAAFELQREKI